MRNFLSILLAGCLFLGLTGCGNSGSTAASSSSAASGAEALAITTDGEMTVYDCGSVSIGLPTQYVDQLTVQTEFEPSDGFSYGTQLISVWETASLEQSRADWGQDAGAGFLFSIEILDQAQYEQYLTYDRSGQSAFARNEDEGLTYIFSTPTDVQFYRSGEGNDLTQSEGWKSWETLCGIGAAVRADMIARNGLSTYSDDIALSREFTYDSPHAYVKYYPYYTFDGSTAIQYMLVLSQPAKQGDGGVWCVERWYDQYGTLYLNTLSFEQMGGEMTEEDYFASVQKQCDAGKESEYATPLGAAEKLTAFSNWSSSSSPVDGSFQLVDGPDTAYTDQNTQVFQYVVSLHNGGVNNPDSLLELIGKFTPDTWGVLGRGLYGSDWWTPLKAVLDGISVGADQDIRDRNMIHLYLSYTGSTFDISSGLAELLQKQQQANSVVFEQVLGGFTAVQQASVRRAL